MLIKIPPRWQLQDKDATDQSAYLNRRSVIAGLSAAGLAGLAGGPAFSSASPAATVADPNAGLYPVPRNGTYQVPERPLTDESDATTYNNFYEFGSHKSISEAAQKLKTRPWTVTINGMVEREKEVDFDTLIRQMPLEERIYRFRCVEAWAMTIPWSGFALKALVDFAKPLSGATYIEMETLADGDTMPGLRQFWYPWPYREGLTIAEATHDLAFIATGLYGKPIAKQNGAPLRLVVPWKYGFKNVKSIVRLTFTDQRPKTFWETINAQEYGFWANVNPKVDHPRWSQASERLLTSGKRVPTRLYNGYAEEVAGLYTNLQNERLFA